MQKNRVPNTELDVSSICLGSLTFGTPVAEKDAIALIHAAQDLGINFVDTANIYEGYDRSIGSAGGVAETIIGKALRGRRDDFVIATKVGMKVGEAAEDEWTSAAAIRKHLDRSLQRLQVDCIDLYYLHKADPHNPQVETLRALDDAIRAGKIRHYGVSNYSAEQLEGLLTTADASGLPCPVMLQPELSLLSQDAAGDLLPLCVRRQLGVAPYRILEAGVLTGKYQRGEPLPPDSRKTEKDIWVPELTDEVFDRLEVIRQQADAAGVSMLQYALRWVLDQPAVVTALVGVKRLDQLQALAGAL